MVKLDPSQEQYQALLDTMHRFNQACNDIAETIIELQSANKFELHKVVYYPIREKYGLSSQLTVRAISKVSEAYKRDKSINQSSGLMGPLFTIRESSLGKGLRRSLWSLLAVGELSRFGWGITRKPEWIGSEGRPI